MSMVRNTYSPIVRKRKMLKVELHTVGGESREILTPWRNPENTHSVENLLRRMLGGQFDKVKSYYVTEVLAVFSIPQDKFYTQENLKEVIEIV